MCHCKAEQYLVEDNSWVEHIFRVKELLQPPHDVVCLGTPLHLHIGSHITASAMLSLQVNKHQHTLLACIMVDQGQCSK